MATAKKPRKQENPNNTVDILHAIAVGIAESLIPPPGYRMGYWTVLGPDLFKYQAFCCREDVTTENALGDCQWIAEIENGVVHVRMPSNSIMNEDIEMQDPEFMDKLVYHHFISMKFWKATGGAHETFRKALKEAFAISET